MRITTMITLPEDVYQFYREQACRLENRTTEQVMADALAAFAAAHEAKADYKGSVSRSR